MSDEQWSTMPCSDARHRLHEAAGFPVGTVLDLKKAEWHERYAQVARSQFNSISTENIFKAASMQPAQDVFQWQEADAMSLYCSRNNKRLHGHTLIWHEGLPQWMQQWRDPADTEEMMRHHIQTIVYRYRGSVKSWDVVNEAFSEEGTLSQTLWQRQMGSDFIEKAFRFAMEADHDALLFYNDFSLVYNHVKREGVLRELNRIRALGIRVDGIGIQLHLKVEDGLPPLLAETLRRFWSEGYLVHLSELDLALGQEHGHTPPPADLLERQARLLCGIFSAYLTVPAEYRHGVTFWGVGDADSWIRHHAGSNDYPLLFDDEYAPKPAYCRVLQLLERKGLS